MYSLNENVNKIANVLLVRQKFVIRFKVLIRSIDFVHFLFNRRDAAI